MLSISKTKTGGSSSTVRSSLLPNTRIHPVIYVEHTRPIRNQCPEISPPGPSQMDFPQADESALGVFDHILGHHCPGASYQWLAAIRDAPLHEAQWQPRRDFIDNDGTITAAFLSYVKDDNLLPHLYN